MISQQQLKELIRYDPFTGRWFWVKGRCGIVAGTETGSTNDKGYIVINLLGKKHRAHRLAWFYMTGKWPTSEIDHINTIRNDNTWKNLREATRRQNGRNRTKQINNITGHKGVFVDRLGKKFRSQITVNRRAVHLGTYYTIEEAKAAYDQAAVKYFGEFARA